MNILEYAKFKKMFGGGKGSVAPVEGTAIPVGEAVGRIYFNTNLSVEETNEYLSQLTYVQTPLYEYPISVIYAEQNGDQICALFATLITTDKNDYQIMVTSDIRIEPMLLFNSRGVDRWRNNGFRVEPNDLTTYAYAVETNSIAWEDYIALTDFNGLPIGAENEKIKNVLSITPFVAVSGGTSNAPKAYHVSSLDELPTNAVDGSLAVVEDNSLVGVWILNDELTLFEGTDDSVSVFVDFYRIECPEIQYTEMVGSTSYPSFDYVGGNDDTTYYDDGWWVCSDGGSPEHYLGKTICVTKDPQDEMFRNWLPLNGKRISGDYTLYSRENGEWVNKGEI